jgi:NAD(P)-dependent dehydrogenase (short-subunit alcohol dehydrogenase family)
VIGACRNPQAATELADLGAELCTFDAAEPASAEGLAVAVGGDGLDIVYNGAGIDARAAGATEANRSALELTAAQFDQVMRVNVTGPMLVVQALAEPLRRASGTVVNVSSQIGSIEVGQRMGRDASYAASKAALNMLTVKQAQALRPDGVTVIALHPGWLRTAMGGDAADLDPADAARQIAETISGLTISDTGRFLRWDGTTHPW